MSARALATALMGASVLALAACGQGGEGGAGAGTDAAIQIAHPNGVVMQITRVQRGSDSVVVDAVIMNGRERDITLNTGSNNSFLLTSAGERLTLVPPETNPRLSIPGGQSIEARLVFTGDLPRDERQLTLVLNQQSDAANPHTSSPRFETGLTLGGGGAARNLPASSALSGMRANPASTLGPATGGGSSLSAGGGSVSSLQVVEALRTELGAVQTERGSVVSLPSDVTFDFDQASLRPEGRSALDTLVRLIEAEGGSGTIAIEGHTDSVGEDAYNQRLSERRAEAVRDYLVERGVPAARLRTSGFGASRPVADNTRPDGSDNEAGRQRNRRVEVVLPRAAENGAQSDGASRLEPSP